MFQVIDDYDIEPPRLYDMGFSHNNCGGFCVRAGQAHYELLLRKLPDVYAHHEAEQEKLMREVPTTRPFLRMMKNKVTNYLTLRQYREHLQQGGEFQEFEHGGCACFSGASSCGLAALSSEKIDFNWNEEAMRELIGVSLQEGDSSSLS